MSSALQQYLLAALSSNTQKAYHHDVEHFMQWGGQIPATPKKVAQYLAYYARSLSVATLTRRVTAIHQAHQHQGYPSPTKAALVKETLQGIRRMHGCAQRRVLPLLHSQLNTWVKTQHGVMGLRDKALLLVGFAGAFRRSELVNIQVSQVRFVKQGMLIHLPRSKTDASGVGRDVAIPFASDRSRCAVRALQAWLKAAEITHGMVFRRVNRYDQVLAQGLSDQSVALVVKRCVTELGLKPEDYAGHSLRAGLVTSAALAGVSVWKIRRQTGHQSDAMLQRYIRESQLFNNHLLHQLR